MSTDSPVDPGGLSREIEPVHAAPALVYSQEQRDLLRRTFAKDATEDEFQLFLAFTERRRLDAFSNDVHLVKRGGRVVFQTGIEGLRKIAFRSGQYAGRIGPFFRGVRVSGKIAQPATVEVHGMLVESGGWVDSWDNAAGPPALARVGVRRHDWTEVAWGNASLSAYRQDRSPTWAKMPDVMLAKCAEAAALRAAFSEETAGLYIVEEAAGFEGDEVGAIGTAAPEQTPAKPPPLPDEEVDDFRKRERLAEIAAKLTAVFGPAPPWENEEKKRVLRAVFRMGSWKAISDLEPRPFLELARGFEDVLQEEKGEA